MKGESREEYKFFNVIHLIDVAIKLLSRTSKECYVHFISIFEIKIFIFLEFIHLLLIYKLQ